MEDDTHCSKRFLTLATVFFWFFLTGEGFGHDVSVVDLSAGSGCSQDQLAAYLNVSAAVIQYFTGLSTDFPVHIILYPQGSAFQKNGFPAWAAGVCREGVIHLRNPRLLLKKNILLNVVSHEFLHAVIHFHELGLPSWFEEGLAAFLFPRSDSQFDPEHSPMVEGGYPSDIPTLRLYYSWSTHLFQSLFPRNEPEKLRTFLSDCQKKGFDEPFRSLMEGKRK